VDLDFHVAQNDGTVKGSGSHDKTGHHCLASDLNGKLDIRTTPAIGCATRRSGDEDVPPHLLDGLHVPERGHDETADLE